mgnify:CR=1 FL=1
MELSKGFHSKRGPKTGPDGRTDGRTDKHTSIFWRLLHNKPFGQKYRFQIFIRVLTDFGNVLCITTLKSPTDLSRPKRDFEKSNRKAKGGPFAPSDLSRPKSRYWFVLT